MLRCTSAITTGKPNQRVGRRDLETLGWCMSSFNSNQFDFKAWSEQRLTQVEQVLKQGIDAHAPANLGQAMRYAVLDGGKRLRPLLVLAAAEAVGVDLEAATVSDQPSSLAALRASCAVELIHAYSLVHDDMPCMDNDVLRLSLIHISEPTRPY